MRIGLSAIITVVSYAMTLARHAPAMIDGRHRIASYAVWEVAVFVLNVLAFLLIGLQLRGILTRMQESDWPTYVACALAVCAAVILVRIIWWMPYNAYVRWKIRRYGANLPRPMMLPTVGSGLVISWAGMRGIVTIAAALALPDAFPYRDLVIFAAFCVVVSTLVVQGLTLASPAAAPPDTSNLADLQRRAVQAQRQALMDLRARSEIGDDAFHAVEEEIDVLDLTADARIRPDTVTDRDRSG